MFKENIIAIREIGDSGRGECRVAPRCDYYEGDAGGGLEETRRREVTRALDRHLLSHGTLGKGKMTALTVNDLPG